MIWLLSLLLIYPFLLLITSPLKRLSLQMAKTGEGDFTTRIHEGGSREICELSNSFNSMVKHIYKLIRIWCLGRTLKGSARVSIPAFRFLRGLPMCNTEYNANVPFASAAFDTCDKESPLHPHSLSAATRLFLPFLLRYRRLDAREVIMR